MTFSIKQGTEALAISMTDRNKMMDLKIIKKDVTYSPEQVLVDPVGKLGAHTETIDNIGGQFARSGMYGFMLPKNKSEYDMILVHQSEVQVS